MNTQIVKRIFPLILLALAGCKVVASEAVTYVNPVWDMNAPDPAIIKAADGYYYIYTTQGMSPDSVMCNIQVLRSPDLIEWEHLGDALPVKPSWASSTQNFWAPHVSYSGGRYYMYFSAEPDPMVKTGTELGLCLAVATSSSPSGPFTDSGAPLLAGNSFINIDPMQFDDPVSGKKLLYWGSGFEPIKVRELDDNMTAFKQGSAATTLVDAFRPGYQFLVEGAWMIYRDGWYYLFFSGDNCCGERAHYAVMVARSHSPFGPFEVYADAEGSAVPILEAGGQWLAPGHNSVITDDDGVDWIVYHAINKADRWQDEGEKANDKRIVLIDRLQYVDGWPMVANRTPSDQPEAAPAVSPAGI